MSVTLQVCQLSDGLGQLATHVVNVEVTYRTALHRQSQTGACTLHILVIDPPVGMGVIGMQVLLTPLYAARAGRDGGPDGFENSWRKLATGRQETSKTIGACVGGDRW
jgi:hypothetical protein